MTAFNFVDVWLSNLLKKKVNQNVVALLSHVQYYRRFINNIDLLCVTMSSPDIYSTYFK